MRTFEITINIENGKPRCYPKYACVNVNDRLVWKFGGSWAINFIDRDAPTEDFVIQGRGNSVTSGRNRVKEEARGHHFRYQVIAVPEAVDVGPVPIFFDLGCPEIIVT